MTQVVTGRGEKRGARSSFGRTVERHPLVFDEGVLDGERSFSLLGFGGYSPMEKEAAAALYQAAHDKIMFSESSLRNMALKDRLWQERLERIEQLTGVRLKNPADQASFPKVTNPQFFKDNPELDWKQWGSPHYQYEAHYFKQYKAQLEALAARHPEHADELLGFAGNGSLDEPFSEEEKRTRAAQALADYEKAAASPYLSGWQVTKNDMAASTMAFITDPVTVASMLIPAIGAWKGVSFAARVGRVMLGEAAVNAGVETVMQAGSYGWRRDIGMQVSLGDSLTQISMAGGIGALFGGALRGGGEGIARLVNGRHDKKLEAAIGRIMMGEATAADNKLLAGASGMGVSDFEARLWQLADEQQEMGRIAFAGKPEAMDEVMSDATARRAILDIYEGAGEHLRVGADYAPPRTGAMAAFLDEGKGWKKGEHLDLADGRQVEWQTFNPARLEVDAGAYQYKSGSDGRGVNGVLNEVSAWDKKAGGHVLVHERTDGTRFIVDGHQRLEVARRLDEQSGRGGGNISLKGWLMREKDGWSVEDARGLAAAKNINEGRGEVKDNAAAIRAYPEIIDDGMGLATEKMQATMGLAKLSDDVWEKVVAGEVRADYGGLVGRMIADETKHGVMLDELVRRQPATGQEAEAHLREAMEAGFRHERPDALVVRDENGRVIDDAGNQPQFLKLEGDLAEPASKAANEATERELAVMRGWLEEKPEIAAMWDELTGAVGMDEEMLARQAETLASVIKNCRR